MLLYVGMRVRILNFKYRSSIIYQNANVWPFLGYDIEIFFFCMGEVPSHTTLHMSFNCIHKHGQDISWKTVTSLPFFVFKSICLRKLWLRLLFEKELDVDLDQWLIERLLIIEYTSNKKDILTQNVNLWITLSVQTIE